MDAVSSNPPQESVVCARCGSSMPRVAAFCPQCGKSTKLLSPPERGVAALSYLTLLPAVVLLFLPGYRRDSFVRFHAWQSILLWGTFLVLSALAILLSSLAAAVIFLLLGVLASLAMFFLWALLSFKAWQGEYFELPVFGMLAARWS